MILEKALKREKLNKKLFLISMIIIGLFLPIFCYLTYTNDFIMLIFLGIIEFLIIGAIIIRLNFYRLNFYCSKNRLKIQSGIFSKVSTVFCDKIVVVHTNKSGDELEIILVAAINIKSKIFKPVGRSFINKFPEASREYLRLKKVNPEEIYYFSIIKRGGLRKYILLETIYRNCVNAVYTSSAIESIKIARMQNELY